MTLYNSRYSLGPVPQFQHLLSDYKFRLSLLTSAITKASILSQEASKATISKPFNAFKNSYPAAYQGLRDGYA
jgi:hypothetical protein